MGDRLRQFSLSDSYEELQNIAQTQTALLGNVCLKGQTTVWYAKPNTGKTLICMALMRDAIESSRLWGAGTYYVAADDTPTGVLEKIKLFERLDVNVLAPGFKGFEAKMLPEIMIAMAEDGSARQKTIILDTLKKSVSLMDKGESSKFADVARRFAMKGGTFLGLAHTNKRTDKDGRPIYAGTSDILDDFDCGYTIMEVVSRSTANERVVQFDCIKRRGDVAAQVAYAYNSAPSASYSEMVQSVRMLADDELLHARGEAEQTKDADIISAVEECLNQDDKLGKMELARAVSARTGVGRHTVSAVIEKYTGEDLSRHRWKFNRGYCGKHVFQLLDFNDPSRTF